VKIDWGEIKGIGRCGRLSNNTDPADFNIQSAADLALTIIFIESIIKTQNQLKPKPIAG
jgi:hypothetical protein